MLHIFRNADGPGEGAVLRSMFEARKSVFVDLLRWDVPVIDDRFEVDQFDDPHATYLVLADGEGRHLASARLLPTDRPHILGDLFPELCDGGAPRGPHVLEITRFCLDRRLRAHDRRIVRDTLVVAIADHAVSSGIAAYTAIAEMGWVAQILSFGWRCTPLGLPTVIAGSTLAAFRIDIDDETPALLSAAGLSAEPAVHIRPPLLAA